MVLGWRMATLLSSDGDSSTIKRLGLNTSEQSDYNRAQTDTHDRFCLRMAVAVESSCVAYIQVSLPIARLTDRGCLPWRDRPP